MKADTKFFRGSISVYVGANEQGVEIDKMVTDGALKRRMSRSEYVVYCIQEQEKRDKKVA